MPEWMIGALAAAGGGAGAWLAIRVELKFLWRDLGAVTARVHAIENGDSFPRRRWSDAPRGRRVPRDP